MSSVETLEIRHSVTMKRLKENQITWNSTSICHSLVIRWLFETIRRNGLGFLLDSLPFSARFGPLDAICKWSWSILVESLGNWKHFIQFQTILTDFFFFRTMSKEMTEATTEKLRESSRSSAKVQESSRISKASWINFAFSVLYGRIWTLGGKNKNK